MFWRRRFYRSPITNVQAGEEKRVLYHKGTILIKQLVLRYDGNDDTGTTNCVWTIKVDSEEILRESIRNIHVYFSGGRVRLDSDAPVVCVDYNDTYKVYTFIIRNLGLVKEGIEIWFKNEDTSNQCGVRIGIVYDVYEEGK